MASGRLYIVATPIGNLEDMSMRALRVLKESDVIAAEDTRHTKKLLTHFGITTPLTSYFEHNEREKAGFLLGRLRDGATVALVSDAGTPGISDPGYRLVRHALDNAIPVEAVPGPCALIALLTVSGLPIDSFSFKGFVPSGAAEKRRFFAGMKGRGETYVMYDSPRRLKDTLDVIHGTLGDVRMAVGRELTKLYEEVLRGTAASLKETLKDRDIKGEVTIALRTEASVEPQPLDDELRALFAAGLPLKDAVKAAMEATGRPRAEVYKEALRIKSGFK